MATFRSIKGTFDVLPYGGKGEGAQNVSSASWFEAESLIRSILSRFDFDEIRTPILEPTEMIEVKQGPYCGDQDKTRFGE